MKSIRRSQTTLEKSFNKRNDAAPSTTSTAANTKLINRSVSAFDLRRHYAHRSIYTKSSTIHLRKKFNFRAPTIARQLHAITSTELLSAKEELSIPTPTFLSHKPTISQDVETDTRPRLSLLTLIRMGVLYFGIEILFSLETALTVPLLLQLKVPENVYSLVWVLSPLLGVLLQPILGILSDRCQSRFGRRKPFIFVLSIGAFLGIALMLNSVPIGTWFGDKSYKKIPIIAVVLTALGVTLLDFCADSTDSPLRAFILDVCNIEDQDTALNFHAFLGGSGGAVGFVLAAINWDETFLKFMGSEMEILFYLSTIIFFLMLIITLTSVKEERFVLENNNQNFDEEKKPLIDSSSVISHYATQDCRKYHDIPELDEDADEIIMHPDNDPPYDDLEEEDDRPITIGMLLKSVVNMPKELGFLIVGAWLGWLAYFSVTLFLTDFVAEVIYLGDPVANVTTIDFKNYAYGIKMGCWCLFASAVSSAVYAFLLEKVLISRVSTRLLFFSGYFIHAICVAGIYYVKNIYIIFGLCCSFGILITTLSTLPYQMLAEFHQDEEYRQKGAKGTKRGIGVDCSLLSSCFFLAQTIIAAITSFLISLLGNYTIVIMSAVLALFGCFWIAIVMIFPEDNNSSNKNDSINSK